MIRVVLVAVAVGMCTSLLHLSGMLEGAERQTLDLRFELRGPRSPTHPILLVTVDDTALAEMRRAWPWPRSVHARVLDQIAKDGPLAVGLTMPFSERSQEREDRILGAAVARARRVVLRESLRTLTVPTGHGPPRLHETVEPPIPAVRAGATAVGFVEFAPDADGVIRSASLARNHGGEAQFSFIHRVFEVVAKPLAAERSQTARQAHVWINYRGPRGTFPVYPYQRVHDGALPPGTFAGSIVLVGLESASLRDLYPTPFAGAWRRLGSGSVGRSETGRESASMSGAEIQANLLETLLSDDAIRRLSVRNTVISLWLLSLLAALVAGCLRPWLATVGLVLLGGGYLAVAQWVFARWSGWIEVSSALIACALSAGTMLAIRCLRRSRVG